MCFQELQLKLLSSSGKMFGTEFCPPMTVLPWSGEVVVWARETTEAPLALFVFGLMGSGLFKVKKKLQKLRVVEASCQHEVPSLCPIVVMGKRLLSVPCLDCSNITLFDLSTGTESQVYKGGDEGSDFKPYKLCAGEPGKLWMVRRKVIDKDTDNRKYDVVVLDCSRTTFTPTGKGFPTELRRCKSVCYLPAPHNALVFSDVEADVLLSVDCKSGKKLWELKGEVDGAEILPVTFSPQHQLILVADFKNKRILVLDPSSGSHLQSLPLPEELAQPVYLCLHNELLFMMSSVWCEDHWSRVLSCFSLT